MILSEEILMRIFVATLGLAGFFVARHIHKEKGAGRPLVCPVRFDCDTVVHSDYSKFFGIPVEFFGMIYYALVFFGYMALSFLPEGLPNDLVLGLALISVGAFLFSMYLIYVQIFILKKACSWCFVSAFICICIFILTIIAYDFSNLIFLFLK